MDPLFPFVQTTLSRHSVGAEIEKLRSFGDSLSDEDKTVFEDLLNECKRYSANASKVEYSYKKSSHCFSQFSSHSTGE